MHDEVARGLGEEDLPAVPGGTDARGPVHVQADIATSGEDWFTGVQAYAHPDLNALWPGVSSNGTLRRQRRGGGVRGAVEGNEEAIARGINLAAIRHLEGSTQQAPVLRQQVCVAITQVLQETRRALIVAEQEGHRSRWQVRHACFLYTDPAALSHQKYVCASKIAGLQGDLQGIGA